MSKTFVIKSQKFEMYEMLLCFEILCEYKPNGYYGVAVMYNRNLLKLFGPNMGK